MRFGDPFAFWFLIFVPALALVYWWGFRRKKRALAAFGNPSLVTKLANLASSGRQWAKSGLIVGGFLFLILALVQKRSLLCCFEQKIVYIIYRRRLLFLYIKRKIYISV